MYKRMKTRSHSKLKPTALGLLLVTSVLAFNSAAQDLPFSSGSTGADGPLTFREIPLGRRSAAMAYDPVRQETLLFGGFNGAHLNDTWAFRGTNWVRLLPATSPVDRHGMKMVWDAARNEMVLFGGTRSSGRLNDTWTWNGTTWTQKNPASSPTARENYQMAYDAARQQVVLFGGAVGTDETWLWDGTNWTLANPATKPQATGSSAMAYDAARQQVVLFGNHGQTWLWNGVNWFRPNPLPLFEPAARSWNDMAYDPVRQEVIMTAGQSQADTWVWNGSNWTQKTSLPRSRHHHSMVWDAGKQRILLFGGEVPGIDAYDADTMLWDGANWAFFSGKIQFFDMAARASGTWNFTSINIPGNVTIRFLKNPNNSPVRWLATDNVTINGALDLNGEWGMNALPAGVPAKAGPGGFDGGRGGIRFDASSSFVGSPGQGPGGGNPGTAQQTSPTNLRDAQRGEHNSVYGNAFLQPLIGGSGGGGGASSDTSDGGNGGAGGGAIMISSSRDITINGRISANGGSVEWSGGSYGGHGSGGAILLRADRVTGPGTLEAFGGTTQFPNGRIRVEGYTRSLTGASTPVTVVSLPSANGELNQVGTLSIASVDGVNVAQPPTGNLNNPDVVFSDAGPVTVLVNANGVPNGTPVRLRITTPTSVITGGPVNLAAGQASFNVTVPAGIGTIQATAEYTQN